MTFEIFTYPFFLKALVAGVFLSILSGYFGSFLVLKKMSFLSSGLAHACLLGVSLAIFFGQEPLYFTLPITLFLSFIITAIHQRSHLAHDAIIGVVFTLAVALGMLVFALKPNFANDALAYLFGDILTITHFDLAFLIGFFVLSFLLHARYFGFWAMATFDKELSLSTGDLPDKNAYLLNACFAFLIVLGTKMIGILLMGAFLVIPAAASQIASRRFAVMTGLSILICFFTTVVGLLVASQINLPTSPLIVVLQGIVFCLALLVRRKESSF